VAIVALFACGTSSAPIVANHATGPSGPPPEPTPSAMCLRLGHELGPLGGPTGGGGPVARAHAIAVMCTLQRWSAKVLDCVVDPQGHDRMACLREPLLTEDQNARWNETFNAWFL
jgi:hypothetical protein